MQVLSRVLLALYDAAAQESLHDFPGAALRLLHTCIEFDGATLCTGEAGPERSLAITDAYLEGRPPSILEDYARIAAHDPLTKAVLNGLAKPLQCDCWIAYRGSASPELDSFARKYGLHHVMLYGDPPGSDRPGRWIALYKESGAAFGAIEEARLQYFWPHLPRAIAFNRAASLERLDPARTQRAFALLNRSGAIEAADAHFFTLLQREWPHRAARRLPAAALACLLERHIYRGKCIEIAMTPQYDYLACKAQALDNGIGMTPAEYAVARRFAQGLSHKEVAREQGVSHHTVRTQLARVYEKLGIHNKAALASRLLSSAK